MLLYLFACEMLPCLPPRAF